MPAHGGVQDGNGRDGDGSRQGPPVGADVTKSAAGNLRGHHGRHCGGRTNSSQRRAAADWLGAPPHHWRDNQGGGGGGGGGRGESREWAGGRLVHLAAVRWHGGGAVSTSGSWAAGHHREWNRVGGLGQSGVGVLIGQVLGDAGHLYSPAHKRGQAMGRRTNGHGCEWTSRRKECSRTATVHFVMLGVRDVPVFPARWFDLGEIHKVL